MAVPRVPAGPALLLLSLFQGCWCGLSGTAAHSVPDLVLEETGPLLGLGSFKWARVRVLCISAFSFHLMCLILNVFHLGGWFYLMGKMCIFYLMREISPVAYH